MTKFSLYFRGIYHNEKNNFFNVDVFIYKITLDKILLIEMEFCHDRHFIKINNSQRLQ